jgi:hypothetical protein
VESVAQPTGREDCGHRFDPRTVLGRAYA